MRDGLTLSIDVFHADGQPSLLFAHGFGQTRGAWGGTAQALAEAGYRCVDIGPYSTAPSVDYVDYAQQLGMMIRNGRVGQFPV